VSLLPSGFFRLLWFDGCGVVERVEGVGGVILPATSTFNYTHESLRLFLHTPLPPSKTSLTQVNFLYFLGVGKNFICQFALLLILYFSATPTPPPSHLSSSSFQSLSFTFAIRNNTRVTQGKFNLNEAASAVSTLRIRRVVRSCLTAAVGSCYSAWWQLGMQAF